MSTPFEPRLAAVKDCFDNGDVHLGHRRLLDAAIATHHPSVYADALAFCDWYDDHIASDKARPAALNEQVNRLLQSIDSVPIASPVAGLKLSAKGIGKKYQLGNFSLQPVDIDLHTGQITGLVGENGNGKTTLLRLLYGDLAPDSGSIQYHLAPASANPSRYDTRARLAFIPQRPDAWYGPLMANLQLAATHYGFKGRDNYLWTELIVARMGLRPFRAYSWSRISSGYKMRFELARTLVKKPEVLLLDEPLANLDVLAQQIILEDLKYMAASPGMPMAVILSSQQLYEVEKVSQQVVFLQKGKAKWQQHDRQEAPAPLPLVLELETAATREQLQAIFAQQGLQKISFNGGVYILYFNESGNMPQVLQSIGGANLPVKYLRDISTSSRRFFDA